MQDLGPLRAPKGARDPTFKTNSHFFTALLFFLGHFLTTLNFTLKIWTFLNINF